MRNRSLCSRVRLPRVECEACRAQDRPRTRSQSSKWEPVRPSVRPFDMVLREREVRSSLDQRPSKVGHPLSVSALVSAFPAPLDRRTFHTLSRRSLCQTKRVTRGDGRKWRKEAGGRAAALLHPRSIKDEGGREGPFQSFCCSVAAFAVNGAPPSERARLTDAVAHSLTHWLLLAAAAHYNACRSFSRVAPREGRKERERERTKQQQQFPPPLATNALSLSLSILPLGTTTVERAHSLARTPAFFPSLSVVRSSADGWGFRAPSLPVHPHPFPLLPSLPLPRCRQVAHSHCRA